MLDAQIKSLYKVLILIYKSIILFLLLSGVAACGSKNKAQNNNLRQELKKENKTPSFNPDSALTFIKEQCDFGPRVPNTKAHQECASYLIKELKRFGAQVIEQDADLKAYNGTILKSKNIIGVFYPEKTKRIILFAHWDSRPFSDHDPNPANHKKPVMGANDGASGVGVLLEIARQIQKQEPNIGIDIVFFDAEDYGEPAFEPVQGVRESWCLGSQYWGENPHYQTKPQYGILLDMVGGKNPEFYMDVISMRMAIDVLTKVWSKAKELGYDNYFKTEQGGSIMDDHLFVNTLTGIPTIDIIDYNEERGFPETWHTTNDVVENISINTLEIVGNTVISVIYAEQ